MANTSRHELSSRPSQTVSRPVPSRQPRPAVLSDRPSFTFIDHDDDLASKRISDVKARKAIRSHVMRDVRRRERLAGLKRTSKKEHKNGPASANGKGHAGKQTPSSESGRSQSTGASSSTSKSSSKGDSPIEQGIIGSKGTLTFINDTPLPSFSTRRFDPFGTLPGSAELPLVVDGLVKHFSTVFMPMTFPVDKSRSKGFGGRRNEPVSWSLDPDPKAFFGHMCLSAAHKAVLEGGCSELALTPRGRNTILNEPYYCIMKAKCFKLMNSMICDPDQALSDAAFDIVVNLISSALVIGDFAEARVHMAGLKRMVDLRGGILSPYFQASPRTRGNILTCDLKAASALLSRPFFPLIWTPQTTPSEITARISPRPDSPTSRVARSLYSNPHLSMPLITAFGKLRELLFLKDFNAYDEIGLTAEEVGMFRFRNHEVEHELLDYPYRIFKPKRNDPNRLDIPVIEDIARVAAISYISLSFIVSPPASGFTRALINHVRASLEACPSVEGSDLPEWCLDLVAWATFIGAEGSSRVSDRQWFLERLKSVSQTRGWREWADVENILREYLYVQRLQGALWAKIWTEAMNLSVIVELGDDR